jgi:eukaryotic-like serine/threonine-protein kinase
VLESAFSKGSPSTYMARREKFGRLVLLQEREASPLGVEYVAARLGPEGLDRLVSVLRYAPEVSAHAEAVARLTEQARLVARLQNPGLLRLIGIGRVGSFSYVSHELVEGRSMQAVVDRCRRDQFPFPAENALVVVSRVAAALDYVHARKDNEGRALFHGLLHPRHVVVSFEGEVKVAALGLWPSLGSTGLLGDDERRCLAPEQAAGGPGDRRSDVYALGLVLLETLTLQAAVPPDPGAALAGMRMFGPAGEPEPLPESLFKLLRRSLAADPAERFADMSETRRAIDAIVFSGEFPSTTFNLAFFMQTIFRDEVERESQQLDQARRADYTEFLPPARPPASDGGAPDPAVQPPAAGGPQKTGGAPAPPPPAADVAAQATVIAPAPAPLPALEAPPGPSDAPVLTHETPMGPPAVSGPFSPIEPPPADSSGPNRELRSRARRAAATREAASRLTLTHATAPPMGRRGMLALVIGLFLAVGGGAGVGYVYFLEHRGAPSGPPPTTLSPEAAAALARVHELEARIAELERQNSEAEPERSPEPRTPSPPVTRSEDEETLRARAEAQRKARLEREGRQAEIRRLEEEKEAAEARLVLGQRSSGPGAVAPVVNPLPTVAPLPPTPAPVSARAPVLPGMLVDVGDPAVVPPVLLKESRASYPRLAWQLKVEGSVLIEALVDEKGQVTDTKILERSGPRVGFEEAAVRQVRTRRYRPATKEGVPVKVWVKVRVNFAQ